MLAQPGFVHPLVPLRERREDIGTILAWLLPSLHADAAAIALTTEAGRCMFRDAWPFNVRQLQQRLLGAVAMASDGLVRIEHMVSPSPPVSPPSRLLDTRTMSRSELRAALVAALREHRGNVAAASRMFGKATFQVRRWMTSLELDPADFRE